jgi:hypothetical protein
VLFLIFVRITRMIQIFSHSKLNNALLQSLSLSVYSMLNHSFFIETFGGGFTHFRRWLRLFLKFFLFLLFVDECFSFLLNF